VITLKNLEKSYATRAGESFVLRRIDLTIAQLHHEHCVCTEPVRKLTEAFTVESRKRIFC
jgi:hypothetical protein